MALSAKKQQLDAILGSRLRDISAVQIRELTLILAPLFLLVLGAVIIGTTELFAMTHPEDKVSRLLGVGLSAATSAALYFFGHEPRILATTLIVVPLAGPLLTLWRLGDMATAAFRAFAMAIGPLLVAVPLTLVAVIRRDVPDGPSYVVMMLMFAWSATPADTSRGASSASGSSTRR